MKKGGKFVFDLLNHWLLKLIELKRIIREGNWKFLHSFHWRPSLDLFEFVNLSQLKQKAEEAGFLIESVISTPITPIFPALNKLLSNFWYRGKRTVYLGFDVIVVLKAV